MRDEDYTLNVDRNLDAIDDAACVLWLGSPNNPSGTHILRNDMDRLRANTPNHVVVVYDEVYAHYVKASSFFRGLDYVSQGDNNCDQ